MIKKISYKNLVFLLLLFYTIIQIYCINRLSPNYDEGSFASYGITILKFQGEKDILKYDSKLPITALNMLPRAIEQVLNPGLEKSANADDDVIMGRYISLLVSLLLGILIFKWSGELYNERTAIICLALYLLCPNFLAHGIFVSSDIFACFFMTLVFYFLWRFHKEQQLKHFLFLSIAAGLAQISKFSMVHLFVLVPLLSLIIILFKAQKENKIRFKRLLFLSFIFLFTSWFLINAAHLFYQPFLSLNKYEFLSNTFQQLQNLFGSVNLPVPLPSSYFGSMDMMFYSQQIGGGQPGSLHGVPYILGHSQVDGFWYYYFVVLFFKMPIPALLILSASIILFVLHFRKKEFLKNEMYLIIPSVYFIVYLSFFYNTQIGIRHIMIIFPLLFIFSGKLISRIIEWRKQYLLFALMAFQVFSVMSFFPHFLPYTNEFITNKKMAYKKIADTNLCYGEGQKFLFNYLSENKNVILSPVKPIAGKIVLDVNDLLHVNPGTIGRYDWLRSLTPVDHIHSQYLVFDVKQSFIDSLKQ